MLEDSLSIYIMNAYCTTVLVSSMMGVELVVVVEDPRRILATFVNLQSPAEPSSLPRSLARHDRSSTDIRSGTAVPLLTRSTTVVDKEESPRGHDLGRSTRLS